MRFYSSHYLEILAEMAAQSAFQRLIKGYKVSGVVTKAVGYLWVFGFLFDAEESVPENILSSRMRELLMVDESVTGYS